MADNYEVELEAGQDVIVASPNFEPTLRRGMVDADYGRDVEVAFTTDPFTDKIDEPRTVTCLREQVIPVDASRQELSELFEGIYYADGSDE